MRGQLRLKLERDADYGRDRFVVSSPNRAAVEALQSWPDERGGALALIGPAGAGKTHLAMIWAQRVGATILSAEALEEVDRGASASVMLLDAADVAPHGEGLFHLLNRAARPGVALLLTGRTPPATWTTEIPDLRSRLNAASMLDVAEPDDTILRGVLVKLFEERLIRPPADVLPYLLSRMERSVPAARALITAIDERASAEHRPITRVLARDVLGDPAENAAETTL